MTWERPPFGGREEKKASRVLWPNMYPTYQDMDVAWDPAKNSVGPLGYLDTHCLCSGCLAASYPSVPYKYVHPGPRYPPRHAVEVMCIHYHCGPHSSLNEGLGCRVPLSPDSWHHTGLRTLPGEPGLHQGTAKCGKRWKDFVLRIHGGRQQCPVGRWPG